MDHLPTSLWGAVKSTHLTVELEKHKGTEVLSLPDLLLLAAWPV